MTYRTLVLLFAAAAAARAQGPLKLTQAEAEAAAVKNYPRLAGMRLEADAAALVPREIRSANQPWLSGSLTGVGADSGSRMAAGALNNPALYNHTGTGLYLSQLVTDFGRTSHLAHAAQQHAQAATELTGAVREELLLGVRRTYLEALRARALVDVAQRTIAARQLVYEQVSALAKNGLKSELDAKFAFVNVSDAQLLLADSRNRLQASEASLAALTGLAAPQGFSLEEPAAQPPLSGTVDDFVRGALDRRPDVLALRSELLSAGQQVKADRALSFPTVSFVGVAGFAPVADPQVPGRYGAAGVNVNIPVFNGGAYSLRRQESDLRAKAAAERVRDLETRVRRDVQVTWLNLATARERLDVATQMAQQARLGMDLAQGRYDLGLGSIVELSQSQLSLTSAELAVTSGRYELELQRAELDYQAGITR